MLNKDLVCYFIEWGFRRHNILETDKFHYTITTESFQAYHIHLNSLNKYKNYITTFKLRNEYYIVLNEDAKNINVLDYAYYYCSKNNVPLKCSNDKEYKLFINASNAPYPLYNPYKREYSLHSIHDEEIVSKFFEKGKYYYISEIPCQEIYFVKAYDYAFEELNKILTPKEWNYILNNAYYSSWTLKFKNTKLPEFKSLCDKGVIIKVIDHFSDHSGDWDVLSYEFKYGRFFIEGAKYYNIKINNK